MAPVTHTPTVPELVVATNNPGKLAELRRLLRDSGYEIRSPADLCIPFHVEETGSTYRENAALKAETAARITGLPALADDSGLEVDILGGRPGPHSARYGGEGLDDAGRVQLLLRELEGVPDEKRRARFRAVVAVAIPGEPTQFFEETVEGTIARSPRGAGGFGYDPIFVPLGMTRTMAELSPEEKDAVSHRGKAMRAAARWLRGRLERG